MPAKLEKTRFIRIHQLMRAAKLTAGDIARKKILSTETMTGFRAGTCLSHSSLTYLATALEQARTSTEDAIAAFCAISVDAEVTARTLEYADGETVFSCDSLVEFLGSPEWRTQVNDTAGKITGGTCAIEHVYFLIIASPEVREQFAKQIKSLKAKGLKANFDAIWKEFLHDCEHRPEIEGESNRGTYRPGKATGRSNKGVQTADLDEEDLQRVKQVREHAAMILQRDQATLSACADVIGRKELRLPEDLDELYGPLRVTQIGPNDKTALTTFLQIVHRLTLTPTGASVDTLLVLRDVAICLSLPVELRKHVIGQVISNDHIVSLPTNYTNQGKLYLGFAHGILPTRSSSAVPRLEVLRRIHEGEVDLSDQLRVVKSESGHLHTTEEPGESGLNGKRFKTQLCQGLAKVLGYPVDIEDRSWPPACIDRIKTALGKLKIVGVQICVVLTEKRAAADIADLRMHIRDLAFVAMRPGSCATHDDLQFEIDLVTTTINRRSN